MPYPLSTVRGLHYIPDYLSRGEQNCLLAIIDQQPWLSDLKRRVQHYGYRYDYRRRFVDPSMYLGALPDWAAGLADRLARDGWITQPLDQLIVNEYIPGHGISSHVDCVPCFGNTIVAISLGSPCIMLFSHTGTSTQVPILLKPGSLFVMREEARYAWKHGIPARKVDLYKGRKLDRGRRVSLTFRAVIRTGPIIS